MKTLRNTALSFAALLSATGSSSAATTYTIDPQHSSAQFPVRHMTVSNVRGEFSNVSTTVNRKDFGLVWNKALDGRGVLVGDEVKITLDIEAVRN